MLCRGWFGGCIRNYIGGSGGGGGWRFQRRARSLKRLIFRRIGHLLLSDSSTLLYFTAYHVALSLSLSLSREEDLPTWMGGICLNSAGLDDVKCKDGRSKA